MADKSITDLNVVPGSIDDGNTWFAVAQSGAAYKVSGHEFILALTSILDGHGGIKSIVYTDPVPPSLTGTMTITLADDTEVELDIKNGKGISSITNTGSAGTPVVDTYTITYNDNTTSTFQVTNGAKGDPGDSWYVWIRYSGDEPTQDADMGTDPDNWMGIYSGTSSTAPVHYTDYDWFQIKGEKGDTGDPATVSDQTVLYQEGTSGTVAPSGTWTTTIPSVSQGNYLWTKTTITFNTGRPVTLYSIARMGVDGTGSVSSVNNQSPDGNGNVTVTATNIGTSDNTSVQTDLTNLKTGLSSAETDIDALETAVGNIRSGLAYVESGNTASQNYSIGDYISWKGVLYIATAAITSGASFVVGTNLEIPKDTNNNSCGGLNSLKNSFNVQWISVYGAVSASWNAQELQLTADISSCIALAFVFNYQSGNQYYTVITPIIAGIPYSGGGSYDDKTISPEVRAYDATTNKITVRPIEWSSSSSNGPRPLVGIYALKITFN